MTASAILVESVLRREGLPLCLCLMAINAQLSACLACLPCMVAFQAVFYYCFGMLFVRKRYLPLRNIECDYIFRSESASGHEDGEQKTCDYPDADQALFHSRFTPFLLMD